MQAFGERRGPIFEFDNGDDDDDDESVTRSSDAEGVNFAFGVFPECLMQAFGEHSYPNLQLGGLQSCMAVPRIDLPIVRGTLHWKPHKV